MVNIFIIELVNIVKLGLKNSRLIILLGVYNEV
jgi:hypothetical protein